MFVLPLAPSQVRDVAPCVCDGDSGCVSTSDCLSLIIIAYVHMYVYMSLSFQFSFSLVRFFPEVLDLSIAYSSSMLLLVSSCPDGE